MFLKLNVGVQSKPCLRHHLNMHSKPFLRLYVSVQSEVFLRHYLNLHNCLLFFVVVVFTPLRYTQQIIFKAHLTYTQQFVFKTLHKCEQQSLGFFGCCFLDTMYICMHSKVFSRHCLNMHSKLYFRLYLGIHNKPVFKMVKTIIL